MKTIGIVTLGVCLLAGTAEAQTRRWAGVGLAAGGVLMTLASGTCSIDAVRDGLSATESDGLLIATISNPRVRGGNQPWPGGRCGFEVDWRLTGAWSGTTYGSGTHNDRTVRMLPGVTDSVVNEVLDDMRGRNSALFFGGLGAIGAGAVLALLPGDGQRIVDLQVDRHRVRLSRSFGW